MGYFSPLLLTALVATAGAVPTGQRYTCAQSCSSTSKFAFERGMSYEYDYKVETTTMSSPTNFNDQTFVTVKGKAIIGVTSPCEYVLSLENVVLEGSDASPEFAQELTKNPLRFAFDDGRISNVCNDPAEETWALNFKRGILSQFQNSMNKLDEDETIPETDITGNCKTSYVHENNGDADSFTVIRTKSSESCNRVPSSSHTALPEVLQRVPILSADQECNQTVTAGIMTEVVCKEVLVLKSLMGTDGGATTAVNTELILKNTRVGVIPHDTEIVRTSMEFDEVEAKTSGSYNEVENILKALNDNSFPVIDSDVPALFSQLVTSLRKLNTRQLTQIYSANEHQQRVWRFLIDAAPLVATSDSTELVAKLVKESKLSSQETKVWYTSLSLVSNPDAKMFTEFADLVKENPEKDLLFGVASMVQAFCKKNENCMDVTEVNEVIKSMETYLGSGCRSASLYEKERILTVLRSFGIMGRWTNDEVMQRCFMEANNPMEVRVAALNAWRKAPCSVDRSSLMNVYMESSLDSELRIEAYLSLMSCPNERVIEEIKNKLTGESVNQVGSFVWTHLSNLQESASHEKQWIRHLIGEEMLVKKFNTSALKFSRNYESSFYMEEHGVGSTIDSNVIFSSQSYLPRSAMMNLTMNLFGQSINLFEIGGRFEGLESFVEKFFGPNGYYPEETIEAVLRSLRQSHSKQETTIEDILDVVTDEPEGSYYVKMFGKDVKYNHFRGLENFFEKQEDFNIMDFIINLTKNGKTDFTKSFKYIDTELSYPTVSGFPLSLKLNSTATLGLRMDGDFKFNSFRDMDINGHIYPSAAIEMDAVMLVDAHYTKSGVKLRANGQTSMFADGKVKIEQGKVVDISVKPFPQEKNTVFEVESEVVFFGDNKLHNGASRTTENERQMCLGGQLLGFKTCVTRAVEPQSFKAGVYLQQVDIPEGIKFRYLREDNHVSVMFDTPKSSVDRKLYLGVSKSSEDITADIYTPWKSAKAIGSLTTESNKKSLSLKVNADNSANIINIFGSIENKGSEKVIEISSSGSVDASVKLSTGDLNGEKKVLAKVDSPVFYLDMTGYLNTNDKLSCKLDTVYSIMKRQPENFNFNILLEHNIENRNINTVNAFSIYSSQFAIIDADLKRQLKMTPGKIESNLSINIGRFCNLEKKSVIDYVYENNNKGYEMKSSLTSSTHAVNVEISDKLQVKDKYMIREANYVLTPTFTLKSKTELGYSDKNGFSRINISLPNYELSQEMSYTKISEGYYTAQVTGKYNEHNWNYEGKYINRSNYRENVNIELASTYTFDSKTSEISTAITADKAGAKVDTKLILRGNEHFFTIKATKTTISLDTNIIKNISMKGELMLTGSIKRAELTGQVEGTEVSVTGELNRNKVLGHFKYGRVEKKLKAELTSNGPEVEITLDESRTILAKLFYDLPNKSMSLSVDTPFSGYERQSLSAKFEKVSDTEYSSHLVVIFRNAKIFGITARGAFKSVSQMSGEFSVVCDEKIFGFEHITLSFEHEMKNYNIRSNILGAVDGTNFLNGSLKNSYTGETIFMVGELKTAVTDDIKYTVNVESGKKYTKEVLYGNRFIRTQVENEELSNGFKYTFSSQSSEYADQKATITYENSANIKTLTLEGERGSDRYYGVFRAEKQTLSNGDRISEGGGKFVLPNRPPIVLNYKVQRSVNDRFTTDVEVTRFWSNYGNVKLHGDFDFKSLNNLKLSTSVITPDTRASSDVAFTYENKNIDLSLKGSYNGVFRGILLSGVVDMPNKVKLRSSLISKEDTLLKISFDHDYKRNTYHTKLNIETNNETYMIQNELRIDSMTNWMNKLTVNDNLFFDEMITEDDIYKYNFDIKLVNGWYATGNAQASAYFGGQERRIDSNLKLKSSFAEDIRIRFTHEDDNVVHKPELTVMVGTNKTTLKSYVECAQNKHFAKFNLDSSYLQYPVLLEINAAKATQGRNLSIVFNNNKKYALFATQNGDLDIGAVTVEVELPCAHLTTGKIDISYDMTNNLYATNHISLKYQINNYQGTLETKFDLSQWSKRTTKKDVQIEMTENSSTLFDITTELDMSSIDIKVNSEVYARSAAANAKYNFDTDNTVEVNFKLDNKEVSAMFTANIENMNSPRFDFSIKTFWNELKNLGGTVSYHNRSDSYKLNIKGNMNDQRIDSTVTISKFGRGSGYASLVSESTVAAGNIDALINYEVTSTSGEAKLMLKQNNVHHEFEARVNIERNGIDIQILSPTSSWKAFNAKGNYMKHYDGTSGSFVMSLNEKTISIEGQLQNNSVVVKLSSPFADFKQCMFTAQLSEKQIKAVFEQNDKTFQVTAGYEKMYKQGKFELNLVTPFNQYKTVSFSTNFNFLGDVKTAEIVYELNNVKEVLKGDVQINNNKVYMKFVTPFEQIKTVEMEADMTLTGDKKSVSAALKYLNTELSLEGELNKSDKSIKLRSVTPFVDGSVLEVYGKKTNNGYTLVFTNSAGKKYFNLSYQRELKSSSLSLQTPFDGYKNVFMSYNVATGNNQLTGSVTFEKEDFVMTLKTVVEYSPMKSEMTLNFRMPNMQDIMISGQYDFTGRTKTAEIKYDVNGEKEEFKTSLFFDSNNGIFEATIPFVQKHVSAKYSFALDKFNKEYNGNFVTSWDSQEYVFSSSGKISDNKIVFELSTPMEPLREIKVEGAFVFEGVRKEIRATANYNKIVNSIVLKYDPSDVEEFAQVLGSYFNQELSLTLGGNIEEHKTWFNVNINTPIVGYSRIKFAFDYDQANEESISIVLSKEDKNLINLQGKLLGQSFELELNDFFSLFKNFHTSGSLNRSKRSLDFNMMNDGAFAGIRASFNSLSIKVTTPYDAVRESSFLLEKSDSGELTLHYQRGDNVVDFKATPTGRRRTFNVTMKSAIPGWEFLAIAGRLDREELLGYLSGQKNEAKMTIEGGGKYSRTDSDLKFDITTPYDGYESVTFKLKFNARRKDFNFEMKSSSSKFIISLKTRPNLTIDVYVPNAAEPTIIKGTLTTFNGNLDISSRFPRVRTFKLEWNLSLQRNEVRASSKIEHNGLERFNLMFERGGNKAHLMITARRTGHESVIHFERSGTESIEFFFRRDGKEFKVEAQGSGDLPTKGSIDFVINNSFREIPREVTGHLEVDRTNRKEKSIKLELTFPGNKLYVIDSKYNINLKKPATGEYEINITTPDRRARRWNNISGSWNVQSRDDVTIELNVGPKQYILKGKLGLRESDFEITNNMNYPKIIATWKYYKVSTGSERTRDHYFKIGTEERFVMGKLKGKFALLEYGDAELAFQASRFMKNPLELTAKWSRDSSGLTGDGTFTLGSKNGTFKLNKLKRYGETRSLILDFEAHTNIPGYNTITVKGEYSFNNEAVVKLDIVWDVSKVSMDVNIQDITSEFTEQKASFTLPGIGDVDITFGHDFRNKREKKYTIVANLMGRESHVKAVWNRNKDFTKLSGNADVQSIFLGHITLEVNYDVRNLNNAKANIQYKRNEDKFFTINWERKFNSNELDASVTFESSLRRFPNASIKINANFREGFDLNAAFQVANRESKLHFKVQESSINFDLTTPYSGFEKVVGTVQYDFSSRKQKSVTVHYERGDKKVDLNMNIELPSRRNGSLKLSLTTPFEIIRTVSLDASWKNGKGEIHYKRNNDIVYNFTGSANVKSDRSSFELNFQPSNSEPVKIKFSYNAGSLLSGDGTEPEKIAELELEMVGKKLEVELNGFRNSERVMINIDLESTLFGIIRELSLKLDSELNLTNRNGELELKVNDFYFHVKNHFERRPDGYYFRSQLDSTLTRLPGLIIGFGREGDARILTVGVGEDREITASFTPKDRFKKGFSGKLSLPRRGIVDAAYDVSYKFNNANELEATVQIQIEPGKNIDANIVYNSDGVQARLSSPFSRFNARAKRSISDSGFYGEIGVNDYAISLKGDIQKSDFKRGMILEGELFGQKVSLDTMLQGERNKYVEGKFIITSSIRGYENIGTQFTLSNVNRVVSGKLEINLPSYTTPRIYSTVNFDFNNKFSGELLFDVSGRTYIFNSDLTGDLYNGYAGSVKINTPYHALSNIDLTGEFKFQGKQAMGFTVAYKTPMHSGTFKLIHQMSSDKIDSLVKIELQEAGEFMVHFKCLGAEKNAFVKVNNNTVSLKFGNSSELKTLGLEINVNGAKKHSFLFKLENSKLEVTLNTNFSGNNHLLNFEHEMPRNYLRDSFGAILTYTGATTCETEFKLDRSNLIEILLRSTTNGKVYEFSVASIEEVVDLKVLLPEHKFTVSVIGKSHPSSASDFLPLGNLESTMTIDSKYLPKTFFKSKMVSTENTKAKETIVKIDGVEHIVKAGYYNKPSSRKVELDFVSPVFDIQKAGLNVEVSLSQITKTVVTAYLRENVHKLEFRYNAPKNRITCFINSPAIPSEVIRATASMSGTDMSDFTGEASLKYDDKTYALSTEIKNQSSNKFASTLEIKTPIRGYRKMNFGLNFENEDKTRVAFYADKPLGYKFEMESSKAQDVQNIELDIATPHAGIETITASVNIPLRKIAPQMLVKLPSREYGLGLVVEKEQYSKMVSGNLNMNGSHYEAGYNLRYKAPYELGYYLSANHIAKRFHIMMDSSVFSLLY